MPQAIFAFIGYITEGIIVGLTAIGLSEAAAIAVLNIGVQLAGLTLLGALSRKLIDIPDLQQTAKNNLLTIRGTLEHQRIIYGEILVSGPLAYINASGTNNENLFHAVVVAGHEVEDMTDMWFDDFRIPEADINWAGNGVVHSGDFRGLLAEAEPVQFEKHLGGSNQAASTNLVDNFTEITSQHQGRGIAYFVPKMIFVEGQNIQVWSGGAPSNYKALVKGKLVYNPNSDGTTSWGTGPHRLANSGTWEYSNDPALCWADYMIDKSLAFGEDPTRIDYAYVASVVAINSAQVATPNSETTNRFACNGTLSTGNTHEANLSAILSSANMTMGLVQGIWKLRGWEFETPTLSFDDDDLRDDIQIELETEERQRYNTVRGFFIDKDRLYKAMPSPAFTSSEYVSRDKDETLFKDIQLPMTTDVYAAQRLQVGILEQSDLQNKVIYPSNFHSLPVEIGGTIKLSNNKMAWVDETFRVTNYKLSDMGGIDLVLQEDNAAAYTPVGTAEYTVSSQGSYITPAPGVPAPTSFTATGVATGIRLAWTNPPARLFEWIDVYESATDQWSGASLIASVRTDFFDITYDAAETRFFWLRARNFADTESLRIPDSDTSTITATAQGAGGADGNSVFVGNVFLRKSTAPTEPIDDDGSYNFTTNVLTPPSTGGGSADDWSITVPAGSNPLYVSSGSFEISGPTGTDSTVDWTAPVILASDGATGSTGSTGTDGDTSHVGSVFLRKATAPTEPIDDDGSYNFTTGTLTPPSTGGGSADDWSITVPAGTDPLYVSIGLFEIVGTSGTDNTVDWTAPVILASDGRPGLPGASTLALYDDADSNGSSSTQGKYHFLTSITDTSGTFSWSTITTPSGIDYISVHKDSTGGTTDYSSFYNQTQVGDIVTWFSSDGRWVAFEVTSIETAPTDMFKWGVSYIIHDETDGAGDIPSAGGNNVIFRWSRASAAEPTVTLSGETITDSTGGNSTATVRVNNDGTVDKNTTTGGLVQIDTATDWVRPEEFAPGDFEHKATATGDALDGSSDPLNTWAKFTATANPEWSVRSSGAEGSKQAVVTVEIRFSGGSVLDSGVYTLNSDDQS